MRDSKGKFLSTSLFILYVVFCLSIIFSFRAITSISIPTILILGIIKNRIDKKSFYNGYFANPLVVLCVILFIVQSLSLLYATDLYQTKKALLLKSAIVIVPLALCCCDFITEESRKRIMKWYCVMLMVACMIALCVAVKKYLATKLISVFLYHALVLIYSGHAIQFSILVFVALIHLVETLRRREFMFTKFLHYFMIVFLLGFLILLSSKLVIIFFIIYFGITMVRTFRSGNFSRTFIGSCLAVVVLVLAFVFVIPNPINKRFREIIDTNFTFLKQERYQPSEYFNGLQFRMLQWRFVPQILDEDHAYAWVRGVSVGDAQSLLNEKYVASNMYVGSPGRGDKGFLGYNTHNQFLECLLQSGIIGLAAFLMIIAALLIMVVKKKRTEFSFITLLLITYCLDESVLETQYSLFIFIFFPLFFYLDKKTDRT